MFNRQCLLMLSAPRKQPNSIKNKGITIRTNIVTETALDTSAFHDVQHSLLWKYHLFNINQSLFDFTTFCSNVSGKLTNHSLSVPTKPTTLSIPDNATNITFSELQNITFHVFKVPDDFNAKESISTDGDQSILQNVIKLSVFYHNLSDHKLAEIVRIYLRTEYSKHPVLRADIAKCSDQRILCLIEQCKQKMNMILYGTAALTVPRNGFEWIAVAVHCSKWVEMTVSVFPDRRWMEDEGASNEYQLHMFIARNLQFSIHQWLNGQSTTSNLSLYLHRAAAVALKAQHIVSRPVSKMKSILTDSGFLTISDGDISDLIGTANHKRFSEVQPVNEWMVSPDIVNMTSYPVITH